MRAGSLEAAFILLVPLAACYTYVPAELESVAPGEELRARVSAQGAEQLREALGGEETRVVEGELVVMDDAGILLSVPVSTRQAGFQLETLRQRVRIAQSDLVEVERKSLNRPKTWGSVGAGVLLVGAITVKVLGGKTGGETAGKGPPVEDIVVPIIRIPIR